MANGITNEELEMVMEVAKRMLSEIYGVREQKNIGNDIEQDLKLAIADAEVLVNYLSDKLEEN